MCEKKDDLNTPKDTEMYSSPLMSNTNNKSKASSNEIIEGKEHTYKIAGSANASDLYPFKVTEQAHGINYPVAFIIKTI